MQTHSCCQGAKEILLNTVIYVLCSIVMICPLFIGIHLQMIPPLPGGIAILFFGAWWHKLGMRESIGQNNTPAACIITAFFFFWLYNGTMLTLIGISEAVKGYTGIEYSLVTKDALNAGLKFAEIGLVFVIAIMSMAYWKMKELFLILTGLWLTVVILWLSKFVFKSWHTFSLVDVGALMAGSIVVLIIQLFKHQGKIASISETQSSEKKK
ncbi:hypothetical protein KKC06_04435 [Patescibacteria group bacterium]|nr:hypothetical protein [Patescibacteria group bacterium]